MFRRFTGLFQRKPQIAEQPVEQTIEYNIKTQNYLNGMQKLVTSLDNYKREEDIKGYNSKEDFGKANFEQKMSHLVRISDDVFDKMNKISYCVMDNNKEEKLISFREITSNDSYVNKSFIFVCGTFDEELKSYLGNITYEIEDDTGKIIKKNPFTDNNNIFKYIVKSENKKYYFYIESIDKYIEIPKFVYLKLGKGTYYDNYIIDNFYLDTNFFKLYESENSETLSESNLNSPPESTGGKRRRQRKTRKQRRRRHQKSRKSRR